MSQPTLCPAARVRDRAGEAEWQVRVDVAAAYRLVARHGMTDMIANHISAQVPDEPGHFLINPYGLLYEEVTASSLVKINLQGDVVDDPGQGEGINYAGFVIHGAIHEARHDIRCIIHTHTPAGMAVSALECGLLNVTQGSSRWSHVAYHDFYGLAVDLEERRILVEDLGDADVMIMRNHGLLALGRTIPEAFNNIYQLEQACRTQLLAQACNTPLVIPDDNVWNHTQGQWQPEGLATYARLQWSALLRRLDREDPSFRN
ncbi:MAG: class II aldolase/adducin family protein [Sphingomonadales bacterium]